MNMEKVDQSQNVLGLSWYDKNIYFFFQLNFSPAGNKFVTRYVLSLFLPPLYIQKGAKTAGSDKIKLIRGHFPLE